MGPFDRFNDRAKRVLAGAQPYTVFKDAIDAVLTGK